MRSHPNPCAPPGPPPRAGRPRRRASAPALAFALLPAALGACAAVPARSGAALDPVLAGLEVDVLELDRAAYPPIDPTLPRVLVVVAHPDDELVAAGLTYLHGARRGGIVDVLTITDGQGGFKYANYAEALTGIELTREDVGRRELPRIRREEQRRGLELLGARRLLWLDECDHRYTLDRNEVLAEPAGVWDLSRIHRVLDHVLSAERYDFVLTLSPTATTHGHHQAAAILAIGAAARADAAERPVVLCCQVEVQDSEGVGAPPAVLADALLAVLRTEDGPFVVDRTRGFGAGDRVNLKSIAAVAIAQHLSQGTMLGYVGRGDLEEYWIFEVSPKDAAERCARLFAALGEGPRFPIREYASNTGEIAERR